MASKANSNRMKRMESKKSHSWWWDSHISPKNSKWLQENLEEMDQHVKRMLKLIEEDADSFAKKAEMYYQKRPELISLVEQFYRMYRSLAERYDIVSGELRKTMPPDLLSHGSGISDAGSDASLPSSDRKPSRSKSGPRAAGFEFFLGGGGGSSDLNSKGDESSTSQSDSDDSSINNYNIMQNDSVERELRQKIAELEAELLEVKETSEGCKKFDNGNSQAVAKLEDCEEELRVANKKLQQSEDEITSLTTELQKYISRKDSNDHVTDRNAFESSLSVEQSLAEGVSDPENRIQTLEEELRIMQEKFKEFKTEQSQSEHQEGSISSTRADVSDAGNRIQTLEEELKIMQEKLHGSTEEISSLRQELTSSGSLVQNLQDQLESARAEVSNLQDKLEKQKNEVSKLQDQVRNYKTSISDHETEVRDLKESFSSANKLLSDENKQLLARITEMSNEQACLKDNLKELDSRCQSLKQDLERAENGKAELESALHLQIDELKTDITEKNNHVEEQTRLIDELKHKHDEKVTSKDEQIEQMSKHLHQLHMQHVKLISGSEEARKLAEDLGLRVEELEREVRMKQELILGAAEEKREAIRQLCFSIEHYRSGYHQLRQATIRFRRLPVAA